jgi:hypothetical protein
MEWYDLSIESRSYIHNRFMEYNIDGQQAFNNEILFPEEIKELNSEQIIELLSSKDISHVLPKSHFPELGNDINNIVLEDSITNRARGAEIMTDNEIEIAQKDYFNDLEEFENNLEFLEDLPEIFIGSTAIGLGVTAIGAYNKIKSNEIKFNEAPRYILVKSGSKIIKCAIIGVCINSGSIVIVSAVSAYYIYKSRGLLIKGLNISWDVLTHPISMNVYRATGVLTINVIDGSLKVLNSSGKLIWNIATHETTKNVVVGVADLSGQLIKSTVKGAWNVATHETTKNIAIGTVKATGTVLSSTTKGVWNLATHETTKDIAVGTVKVTGKVLSSTAKGAWNIATHETTKDIAVGTVNVTGKVLSSTAKGIWSIAKFVLKKK